MNTTANSSFQLISYVDGEDVSDFVEISVWVPDDEAEFDETEDIYTWSNFEEEESSKDADDVSIDLSGIEYAWLEIDNCHSRYISFSISISVFRIQSFLGNSNSYHSQF
jgi:hypothetical protein